jgi:hypothetical protein
MNKATVEILSTLAVTGVAVVCHHKKNEMKAFEELKTNGIIYVESERIGYSIVKFGRSAVYNAPTVTRVYTPAV